jgi:putative sterol carrier protein
MPAIPYARLPDLADGLDRAAPTGLDSAIDRLRAAAKTAGEQRMLQLSIGGPGGQARREVDVAMADGAGTPDVTVRCSADTLWRLLDGSYSPVEAFRDGQMQLDGDEKAAKRLLRHLAGPDGLVDCR